MTLPLPWAKLGDPQVQENFEKVAQQFPLSGANLANDVLRLNTTGTSRKVAYGSATVVFTASVSGSVVVSHGLGVVPTNIQLTIGTTLAAVVVVTAASVTSSQFTLGGLCTAVITANIPVYWEAVG